MRRRKCAPARKTLQCFLALEGAESEGEDIRLLQGSTREREREGDFGFERRCGCVRVCEGREGNGVFRMGVSEVYTYTRVFLEVVDRKEESDERSMDDSGNSGLLRFGLAFCIRDECNHALSYENETII